MKIVAITQARSGSTRLPNKVLKKVNNQTLLDIHLNRIKKSQLITELVVATTTNKTDQAIVDVANKHGLKSYQGSEENVLDRFYQCAKPLNPDWVIRLTSDCPLIDPNLIDNVIDKVVKTDGIDYGSNVLECTFPDGQDIEIFRFSALEKAWKEADLQSEKEHVTPYIHKNSDFNGKSLFKALSIKNEQDFQSVRLTVDTPEDFEVITAIISALGTEKSWKEYVDLYLKQTSIREKNSHIQRNEGYVKSLNEDTQDGK